MAVTRTVLPRKGLIQPQHGLASYEADFDNDMALLDANVAFMSDLMSVASGILSGLGLNGKVNGLTVTTSSTLYASIWAGTLYSQGAPYVNTGILAAPVAPASTTSYFWYNPTNGFYFTPTLVPNTAGDAFIAEVTASSSAVTSVVQGTNLFGAVPIVVPSTPGVFAVPHWLGRLPIAFPLRMTSAGAIWSQVPPAGPEADTQYLYLLGSAPNVTGKAIVW